MTEAPATPPPAVDALERPPRKKHGKLSLLLLVLRQRPLFAFGYAVLLTVILVAIFAPLIAPYDPQHANADALLPPSGTHLLGTDISGMDIFSRVVYSARIDLTIAVIATAVSLALGTTLGLIVGFFAGGRGPRAFASGLTMRAADVLQAFPVFVLALALVAALGPSPRNVIIAIAFVNVPLYLRLIRTETLSIRKRRFVDAARVAGTPNRVIITRHILPNAIAPAIIQASVNMGWAILLTAALSFAGAGVRVPTPEWGSMIAVGAKSMITGQWWPAVFPGIAIALTVMAMALVGDSLEMMLDPVRRRRLVRNRP